MNDTTVDITTAVPTAIKVYADSLVEGDVLFDTHGGEHKITSTRLSTYYMNTLRDDGWRDCWNRDDIVTIKPGDNPGRDIDFASSGSRQGFIDTGRYSTVAEELEFNPTSHQEA